MAHYPTFAELVEAVLQRLSLAEGVDAQIYAEPRIMLAVQHKFDILFREYWWPQYTTYQEEYLLDGVNGHIVGDLTDKLIFWEDLHSVIHDSSPNPLPIAPMNIRHADIQAPTVVWHLADETKMFNILPVTTTGKVWLTYRTKPDDFQEDDDEVKMDKQLMILGTCFDILEDDGTNPGAADKFKAMFQDQVAQTTRLFNNLPRSLVMGNRSVVTRWR